MDQVMDLKFYFNKGQATEKLGSNLQVRGSTLE